MFKLVLHMYVSHICQTVRQNSESWRKNIYRDVSDIEIILSYIIGY